MKRFEFSLASVLQLRNDAKETAMQELAIAVAQLEELNSKIAQLKIASPDSQSCVIGAPITTRSLANASRARHDLQRQIVVLRDEAAIADQKLNACRASLAEANRNVSMLEKLRAKRHAEYLRQAQIVAEHNE